MDECYGACWCQGTTCPWPVTQREKSIELQEEQEKVNTSKKPKRKKYLVLVRVILKHLIEVLISSNYIKFVQQTSKINLIKWIIEVLSSPSLIPSTHLWEGLEVLLNTTTTTSGKKKVKKKYLCNIEEDKENTSM